MKECPKCKGYGFIGSAVPDILRGRGAIFSSNECDMCHGSGEVPTTNEEWFASLPTEEKAKFIFRQHFDVYGKTIYELMVNASKGVSRDKQAEVMIGAVVEWLKEIHK